MRNNQVNFGDILPETSKSSAFWDVGMDSHLKWPLLFSPDEAGESGRHKSLHQSETHSEHGRRTNRREPHVLGLGFSHTEWGGGGGSKGGGD